MHLPLAFAVVYRVYVVCVVVHRVYVVFAVVHRESVVFGWFTGSLWSLLRFTGNL